MFLIQILSDANNNHFPIKESDLRNNGLKAINVVFSKYGLNCFFNFKMFYYFLKDSLNQVIKYS